MTEKELYQWRGKDVLVVCSDGQRVEGFCCMVTKALDNEPEVASITLETQAGLVEIALPEIETMQLKE